MGLTEFESTLPIITKKKKNSMFIISSNEGGIKLIQPLKIRIVITLQARITSSKISQFHLLKILLNIEKEIDHFHIPNTKIC